MTGAELILMKAARGGESIQMRTKIKGYHSEEEPTATINEDPQCRTEVANDGGGDKSSRADHDRGRDEDPTTAALTFSR
jgi:hypothetical protein